MSTVRPDRYDPKVDRLSQRVLTEAQRLAQESLDLPPTQRRTPAELQRALLDRSTAILDELKDLHRRNMVSHEQFHGIDGQGGEAKEIRDATQIAIEALRDPQKAAKTLSLCPVTFTSDIFHNLSLTADSNQGSVYIRFGTHGGLEQRHRAPNGDGFPFPATKWVEGDVVFNGRIYSFVDMYTDRFRVTLDPTTNAPTQLEFSGVVDVKSVHSDLLETGKGKWTGRLPATQPEGKAELHFVMDVSSKGGEKASYGIGKMGFFDGNFALTGKEGTLSITPIRDDGAPSDKAITLSLGDAFGALEEGQYANVPRKLLTAYNFAQGQAIDGVAIMRRALSKTPEELGALFSGKLAESICQNDGRDNPELALILDRNLRLRAKTDADLRRRAASILIANLAGPILPPATDERTTTTQFQARLLSERAWAGVLNQVLGRTMDEAGELHGDGSFESYEGFGDLVRENPDYLDPVAVLNVNVVPLHYHLDGKFHQAALERRTTLHFNTQNATWCLGFQEVFHEKA